MAYAMGAVREGLSARASLQVVRDTGWAVSNERWFRAYRNAQSAIDLQAGFANLTNDVAVPAGMHAAWSAGTPGDYVYRVTMRAYDPETGLTADFHQMVRSPTPLSPGEAAQQIYDEWSDPENVNAYGLQPVGAFLTGAYITTGQDA